MYGWYKASIIEVLHHAEIGMERGKRVWFMDSLSWLENIVVRVIYIIFGDC